MGGQNKKSGRQFEKESLPKGGQNKKSGRQFEKESLPNVSSIIY